MQDIIILNYAKIVNFSNDLFITEHNFNSVIILFLKYEIYLIFNLLDI